MNRIILKTLPLTLTLPLICGTASADGSDNPAKIDKVRSIDDLKLIEMGQGTTGVDQAAPTTNGTSAFAQASLNPYIQVDVGLGDKTYGNKVDQGPALGFYYGKTRLGFNGSADIGDGLKAVDNFQGRFSAAAGDQPDAAKISGAAANAGISGGFGTITDGLNWSPFDGAWGTDALEYNGFSAIGIAYYTDVQGDRGTTGFGTVENSILYVSPKMSGMTVSAIYAPKANKYYGLGVSYAAGSLSMNLGTEHMATATYGGAIISTSNSNYTDAYIIGAAYKLGDVTVDASHKAAKATGDTTSGKDSGYGLGLAYALSATGKLAVGVATDTATADGMTDSKINALGMQYTKVLSKHAKLYAGALKSDKNALVAGPSATYTTMLYAVGVLFSF